ncbi:MAG: hypothetical protein WAM60_23540 [Candidatus Promineifilaceae bacterium]
MIQVYKWLLLLYPADFRQVYGGEMVQLFGDMWRDAKRRGGLIEAARFWLRVLVDTAVAVPTEHIALWRLEMKRWQLFALVVGLLLLAYSASFALFNGLKYSLGLSGLWNPFDGIVAVQEPTLWQQLMAALVVVGPLLALGLFALPLLRVDLRPQGERLATITVVRGSGLSILLIGLCVVLGALFVLFYLGENWACLVGSQVVC